MNPWALLVLLLGVMLIIIGVKGTQHNITSAITGVAHTGATPQNTPVQPPGTTNPQTQADIKNNPATSTTANLA